MSSVELLIEYQFVMRYIVLLHLERCVVAKEINSFTANRRYLAHLKKPWLIWRLKVYLNVFAVSRFQWTLLCTHW